jgi:cytochrome b6-f complex iron-sulfur subunit
MSCEDCLNRRAFLAKSALAAAAAALATGCGNGEFGPPLPAHGGGGRPSGSVTIRVSNFPELATVGTLVAVATERAAMRTGASTFLALSTICTHQGCDADVANNIVVCPCHGSRFDKNGNVINGPAEQPLVQLQAAYNAQTDELTIS